MTKGEGSVRELRDYCRDKLQTTPHKALVSLVQVANGRQLKEIKELSFLTVWLDEPAPCLARVAASVGRLPQVVSVG